MQDDLTDKYIDQIILKLKRNEREAAWVIFQDSMRVLAPQKRQILIEALVRHVEEQETPPSMYHTVDRAPASFAPQGLNKRPEISMFYQTSPQANGYR